MGDDFSFTVSSNVDGTGTGIGSAGLSDSGVSVAGSFTDTTTGTVYEAAGNGKTLTGTSGSAEGLKIQFSGTSTGTYGEVNLTLGFAARLSRLATTLTDSLEGPIHTAIEGYKTNIQSINDDIESIELRLTQRESYLTDQFTRANQALQQLSYLQSSLSSQLNSL